MRALPFCPCDGLGVDEFGGDRAGHGDGIRRQQRQLHGRPQQRQMHDQQQHRRLCHRQFEQQQSLSPSRRPRLIGRSRSLLWPRSSIRSLLRFPTTFRNLGQVVVGQDERLQVGPEPYLIRYDAQPLPPKGKMRFQLAHRPRCRTVALKPTSASHPISRTLWTPRGRQWGHGPPSRSTQASDRNGCGLPTFAIPVTNG